eukprot:g18474.t1
MTAEKPRSPSDLDAGKPSDLESGKPSDLDAGNGIKKMKMAAAPASKEYWSSDESGGSDAESQRLAGNFFFKKKRFEKAITHFSKAITMSCTQSKFEPGDERENEKAIDEDKQLSRLYSNRAMCFNLREEYRKAVCDGKAAVAHDGGNAKGWYQTCKALFALQEWKACVETATTGVETLKSHPTSEQDGKLLEKEWLLKARRQLEIATKAKVKQLDGKKLAMQDPGNERKKKLVEMGKLKYARGDLAGAIEDFEKVLAVNTEVAEEAADEPLTGATKRASSSTSCPVVALPEQEETATTTATPAFAVVDVSHDLVAHEYLAKCFMRLRRPKEAYDVFRMQLQLQLRLEVDTQDCRDKIAETYSNMGTAAKQAGQLENAIGHLEDALKKTTNGNELSLGNRLCGQILQNLGQAYSAAKDLRNARDAYQRSLQVFQELYGGKHGCVALSYLCLARLPAEDQVAGGKSKGKTSRSNLKTRLELYSRTLEILDIDQSDVNARSQLLQELPEVPSEAAPEEVAMSDSHEPPGSPEAAAALLDALSVAGGGSGGVPAWFEELLGVDFEYSLEQEFQSFEEQTLNATFTVAQIIPLVDKIPALIRENCSGTGVSTALDQIGGDSSSSAADHLGEYLKAEFRKHFGGSAGEEDRPFPLSGEAFVQFGKYLALKGYLKGIASVQTASEGAGGGGAADEAAPAASDMENVAISGSEGFSESEAQKVARDEVAQERTNDLVSTAVGEIIARKTPSTPTAERQGGVVAGKGGPPGGSSSGGIAAAASPSKYHQVQPFFRTGPMPLPKQKVDTAAKIKYPKLRPDARFQTMAGNLRGTTTKGSFSPRRIPSVLDKREAITLFLWLEEDVKNVYEFRDRVGNGMPLWLDGVLHGEDFKEKEVVKNLRSYLPQEGAAQVDIKPVVHHFKNIYPPGKNLGLEDFVEACIFLVARAWIADQMGGEAQGTFAPSPKALLARSLSKDSELVTKLKNEVSWLHAQLAEQRKLEYKTFSSGPDVEKKTRNRREGLNPLEMNENNPLYSAAKAPPLRYGVMSDKVLREHEQSITSKISITSESAQKPNSVSSGAVQVVKNIADGVHGGPLDGSRGAEEEQPGRFKIKG